MKIIKADNVILVDNPKGGSGGFQKAVFVSDGAGERSNPSAAAEMERLREAWAKQTAEREAAAFERGRVAGRREAEERYNLNMKKSADALENIVTQLINVRREIIAGATEDLVRLALTMAEKVIHHELTVNREVVGHVLRAALKEITDRDNVVVRLHPEDYRYITAAYNDFLKDYDGMKNITFQEDASIARGGVIVETPFGDVDAR
ncbi:MAG: FliH/SctL family protein, partial [Syntrophales bacterium]|nr:FliH/SctL family protein [Syntrophales bacterium]